MALPILEFPPYEGVSGCNYPTTLDTELEDNSIRTDMQNGTVKTRPWSTKTRTTFNLSFPLRTFAEAKVLEDFYAQVKMYTPFTWTHPTERTESIIDPYVRYAVRFKEPIKISQDGSKPFIKDITMILEEV